MQKAGAERKTRGRFGPNDNLSRAQLAQILHNKEGRPVVNYLLQFDDVSGEVWYTEVMRWAVYDQFGTVEKGT